MWRSSRRYERDEARYASLQARSEREELARRVEHYLQHGHSNDEAEHLAERGDRRARSAQARRGAREVGAPCRDVRRETGSTGASPTLPRAVAPTTRLPVRSLMGPGGRSFSQGHGTTPFAGRRDHPRGRGEEIFAASWDQPICRGKGPAVPDLPAGHESSDREVSQGSFRRRRGSPSGGAHALPGADDDRHQRGAAPLVGAAESSPHRA